MKDFRLCDPRRSRDEDFATVNHCAACHADLRRDRLRVRSKGYHVCGQRAAASQRHIADRQSRRRVVRRTQTYAGILSQLKTRRVNS